MSFQEFATLPPYEPAQWADGKPIAPAPGFARWSGQAPPPAIGQAVQAKINDCGPAIVTGYFVEAGWLGVKCRLLSAPDWHRKQNNGDPAAYCFGAELEALTIAPDELERLDIMAALQAFADTHGRNWKRALSDMWMNGRDERQPNAWALRTVRNRYGPSWLYDRCKIKPWKGA